MIAPLGTRYRVELDILLECKDVFHLFWHKKTVLTLYQYCSLHLCLTISIRLPQNARGCLTISIHF